MSNIVLICFREPERTFYSDKALEILSKRLTPDNIEFPPPKIIKNQGLVIGLIPPVDIIPIKSGSVCLGCLIDPREDWWRPLANIPDGSYALFRSDEKVVELVSDAVASRTVWYAQTKDQFIASTSQRAVVFFLQKYKPNQTAFLWMLSSGSLGNGMSWDRNVQRLGANSRLVLNRSAWEITIKKENCDFTPDYLSDYEHRTLLEGDLRFVFKHLNLEPDRWILPLSGGYDSRGLLNLLGNQQRIRCITWGLKTSLSDKKNDAFIAKSIANYYHLDHEYYETDLTDEPVDKIFNRFLIAGEGRVDSISAYLDGFELWRKIFNSKYVGIIRGDEGFGWVSVRTALDVRHSIGGSRMFSDYANTGKLIEYGRETMGEQSWPEDLHIREGETLSAWRDRLYCEYRIPTILAALNHLKSPYVEIINPYLSRRIIERIRRLPDHLRTDKILFKEIVNTMSLPIGFAKYPAIADYRNILKTRKVVELVHDEVNTVYGKQLLGERLVNYILDKMVLSNGPIKTKTLGAIKRLVPANLRNLLINTVALPKLDPNVLAFRTYIICKMTQMLSSDAKAGSVLLH